MQLKIRAGVKFKITLLTRHSVRPQMSNTCTYHFEEIIGYCLVCRYYICTPCLTDHLDHLPKLVVFRNYQDQFDSLYRELSLINQSKADSLFSAKSGIERSKSECMRYYEVLQQKLAKEEEQYKKTASSEKYMKNLQTLKSRRYNDLDQSSFEKLFTLATNNQVKEIKQQNDREAVKLMKILKSTQESLQSTGQFFSSQISNRPEDFLFQKAQKLFEDKKYQEAASSYSKGLDESLRRFINSSYSKHLQKHTDSLKQTNDNTKLQSLYRFLYFANPNDPVNVYNMGTVYLSKKEYDQGLECIEKSQKLGFKGPELFTAKGDCYFHLGDKEGALKMYDRALELQPTNPIVQLKKANLYKSQGDFKKAENCIEKSMLSTFTKKSEDKKIQMAQAQLFEQNGSYTKAIELFNKIIQADPHDPRPYFYRGRCEFACKYYEKALPSFDSAIKRNPNIAQFHYWKAKTSTELGKKETSIKSIEDALSIERKNLQFLSQKGRILAQFKQYDKALECYYEVLHQNPNDHETWYRQGNLLQAVRKYPDALKCYSKAQSLKPDRKYIDSKNKLDALVKKNGSKCFG